MEQKLQEREGLFLAGNNNDDINYRIWYLRTEKMHETQEELASAIGEDRGTIRNWENRKRLIKAESIIKLAQHFQVSADYLLHLTEVQTPDTEKRAICEELGLTDVAIETLSFMTKDQRGISLWDGIYDLEPGYEQLAQQCISGFLSQPSSYQLFALLASLKARMDQASKVVGDYNNASDPAVKESYRRELEQLSKKMKVSMFEITEAVREIADYGSEYLRINNEINRVLWNIPSLDSSPEDSV